MKKKLFIVLLSLFCLFLLISCRTGEPAPDDTAASSILTNVFRGTSLPIPDGYRMEESFTPYCSPETGELSVLCCHDWGADFFGYLLMTYDSDGSVIRQTELPLTEDNEPTAGAVTEDSLFFLCSDYNRETKTYTYIPAVCSFGDMSITYGDNIAPLFSHPDGEHSRVVCVAADPAGNICVGTYYEILLLDRNLKKKASLFASAGDTVSDLSTAPDGTMYAVFDCGSHFRAMSVDPDAGSFGHKVNYPFGFASTGLCFGSGYDIFLTDSKGFYGYNTGDEDVTLLLDYQNTGLYQGIAEFLYALSPDCVLLLEQDPGTGISYPKLYKRSEDIDLSEIRTIEIAFTSSRFDLQQQIFNFNRSHTDVQIIALDYGNYREELGKDAAWQKLMMDMKTGVCTPDIITDSGYSHKYLLDLYRNGLYIDLYPLLEQSDVLSPDDLLGSVRRTFETEKGELWAVGHDLTLHSLVGKTGNIGSAENLTLSDLLDLAQSVPDGGELIPYLTRERALENRILGATGYACFMDPASDTCDFTSGEFVRYLQYLKSLPREDELSSDASEETPYGLNLINDLALLDTAEIIYIHQILGQNNLFMTRDLNYIGYPAPDGYSGISVSMYPYVITPFCKYPADAWEFIEGIITKKSLFDEIPAFRSLLNEKLAVSKNTYWTMEYGETGGGGGYYDPENPPGEPREGFVRWFFTEEDSELLLHLLEEKAGIPLYLTVDEEVSNIINEEISAFLAGARTAEDCAALVQSRVSLWLAEHQ
ncbi:MAG: hypothetical protein IJF78_01625 [Clostridia bacterium]|nr:hypothetical protein [Clostridia bacterium]